MRTYWKCQIFVFLAMISTNMFTAILMFDLGDERLFLLFLRTILGALSFILISHFVLRNFAKRWAVYRGKARANLLTLMLISLICAPLHFALGVKLVKQVVTIESTEEVSSLRIHDNDEALGGEKVKTSDLATLIFYIGYFWLWSGCYLGIVTRREKRVLAKQLQEQQLANLMNQVNPHFLFNSLNTIRALIYQDKDKAAEVVTQLSELFRYNLMQDMRALVTLKEEWKVCEDFLGIEQVRLGKRLSVTTQGLESFYNIHIPSMSLFTLLENAVKHGIAHLPKGGEIAIQVVRKAQNIHISVTNPYDATRVQTGTQQGLKNIQARLALMYNKSAKLTVNDGGGLFQATLEIPYESKNNN